MTNMLHHFNILTPKPANESGYTFNAIGNGVSIFRWDKSGVCPTAKADVSRHWLEQRIGNWKSKSRLPLMETEYCI